MTARNRIATRRSLGVQLVAVFASVLLAGSPLAFESISPANAAAHIGESATVCGVVVSPKFAERSRGQPTFLNLDRPYPNQVFTAVIWGDDRQKFGAPEVALASKRICVTGLIESYRSRPEIILRRSSQLSVQ